MNHIDTKEELFHLVRYAFICVKNRIVEIPSGMSHKEWVEKHHYASTTYLKNHIRGYILNDILHLYIGDFEVPNSIPICVLELLDTHHITEIHLGCKKGKPGEIWNPIKRITIRY